MTNANELKILKDRICEKLKSYKTLLVAFSGGVDSTLVLKFAIDTLGVENVIAATGLSPTFSKAQQEIASQIISLLGVRYLLIKTEEFHDPRYIANTFERCYFCKHHLFQKLISISHQLKIDAIADGTNLDDKSDDYRPGLKAIEEFGIISPLLESKISKKEIYMLAENEKLPNAKMPSNACLASRIPYGIKITREILQKIEEGESFLQSLGFSQIRLRYHDKLVRIEVLQSELMKAVEPLMRTKIVDFMKSLGFYYVTLDLQGYKMGSLNIIDGNNKK